MFKLVIAGTAVMLLTAAAPPAQAQSRPFQGLFGAPLGPPPPQSLNLVTSMFGAYDTNLPRLVPLRLDGDVSAPNVHYSDLHTGLWYTRRGERTSMAANGAATVQHYPQLSHAVRWSGAGAVAIRTTARRFTIGIDQEMRFSPYAHFRVIPIRHAAGTDAVGAAAPDVALAVTGRESYQYNTTLNLGYQMTRRTMFNAEYQYELLDFVPREQRDWRTQDASVSISHTLTPKTAFVAGYAYHGRDFQGEHEPLRRHDINIGVNYNSSLPFSPRTTFSFTVGSTALSRDRETQSAPNEQSFIRLIGAADLAHRLGRNWTVGTHYNRWVQYIEGFSDVFMAHSMAGNIAGYLGPRVDLRASAGYSTGPLRYGPRQRAYDTAAASARLRVALSRGFAAQAEYVHYRYLFSDAVTVPTGIPVRGNRHVFRVGLTTWFPLLN
jgi:hypothetical protein